MSERRQPKLLFLVTEDWYFWSHRLAVARAALRAGFEVIVATHVSEHSQRIRDEGFRLVPLLLARKNANPLRELRAICQVVRLYRRERPDVVHHVALKPVLYGSVAAAFTVGLGAVNAIAGLGYLQTSSSLKARFLRRAVWSAYRWALNRPRSCVLVQNDDDAAAIRQVLSSPERLRMIPGCGADTQRFAPTPEPQGTPLVVLAGRMLWNKGIREFVEAAEILRGDGVDVRFALVGRADDSSPTAIPIGQLAKWQERGTVEWWNHREDMSAVFQQATLVCLPSYREGLPKVLVEATAAARAVIATDVPGCRVVVRDGVNGLLVPAKDARALAAAIRRLLSDCNLRAAMAARGREIAVREFSDGRMAAQTLDIYRELLELRNPGCEGQLVEPRRT